MLAPASFAAFLFASVLVTLAPGPDNLMVLGLGMARGRRAGMAFGLGCASGCLSHTLLAAFGVGAAIAASPLAFATLKVGGGLYLLWLGLKALRQPGALQGAGPSAVAATATAYFRRGLLANAMNPKVALFFLAFLPQFLPAAPGGATLQVLLLGLAFTLQAALLFGLLGYFAGAAGNWLQRHAGAGRWLDRVAGGLFLLLGLRLVLVA